ncbi:MAG: 2-isopropylmalate synthase [Myxococcales bacterium]|nr:2-isopropylmalate synthase [Myxococcales bacterium]
MRGSSPKADLDLIYDWNELKHNVPAIQPGFTLMDETLRDGIQSPSVRNPSIEDKLEIVHLMERCGIEYADVGLPGAGAQAVSDVTRIIEEVRDCNMALVPNTAARTHPNDISAVVDISQKTGMPIEICAFIGSSPIRQLVEGWDLDKMTGLVRDAVKLSVDNGCPLSFVTEDTIRAHPTTLSRLFWTAIEHGADRLILTDTVGHATPDGLFNLLTFTRSLLRSWGAEHVKIDWHGHNDRGLALALNLFALEHGVDRVHGTCVGVGERVGNASIDQLLINLKLLGVIDRDLTPLRAYVDKVSTAYDVPIPYNYPVFGTDAFRTATGVHAAAVIKALRTGRKDLADRVYSSVPAGDFGCRQRVDIGFYSGKSNIQFWLHEHGLDITDARVQVIWDVAKSSDHTLSDDQIVGALVAGGLLDAQSAAAVTGLALG